MKKLIFKLFYKKEIYWILFCLLLLVMNGCRAHATGSAAALPSEKSIVPQVYFCPAFDCGKLLERYIDAANYSVHCAFYDLNLRNVINALAKKSDTADVKLVMDGSNYNSQIKGDGLRLEDKNSLMHNKFCIIDDYVVITGSFNPTDNDNYKNNNNMMVIHSLILSENYENEFNELWEGGFSGGNNVKVPIFYLNDAKFENYFCPEDKCADNVVDSIKNARDGIYFMAFSFTSNEIADAIMAKKGLDIRGIFDSGQASIKYSQYEKMKNRGFNVKKDSGKYKLHHKVFILDNETVVTGSFNPTLSADTANDENVVIIHDKKIAMAFLKEFNILWQQ